MSAESQLLNEARARIEFLRPAAHILLKTDTNYGQLLTDALAVNDTLRKVAEAASSLANGVEELLREAPAEWDGGSLGYLVGGIGSDVEALREALKDA